MIIRPSRILLFSFLVLLFITSCSKINEATDLGGDIIPGVDGVNTFDTTLTAEAYNSIFDPAKDSLYIGRNSDHILGSITNDPFFGKTDATIFLQLKPDFYQWNFSSIYNKDSLYIDSVVMVLGWTGTYGDTTARQRVNVYEMNQSDDFRVDSFYLTRENPFPINTGNLLGTKDFFPYELRDSIKAFQDTTAGQLRIRLNNSFGQRLLNYDTTNAYKTDSAFNTFVKGFAIAPDATMGNALMSFGLGSANTKLAIYYRFTKGGQNDTTVSYFKFTAASARHNYINRQNNFAGTPLAAASATTAEDPLIYLVSSPGSYATVKIPGVSNMSNRIINRAELIVEEVYDPSDLIFTPPDGILLDVYDTALHNYKFTPYDFTILTSGVPDAAYGMYGKNALDNAGNPIRVWKINITRYIQNVLTQKEPLHDFRLVSGAAISDFIRPTVSANTGAYNYYTFQMNSKYAFGRVRVGGGNHPTQKMRLHIIYTKI